MTANKLSLVKVAPLTWTVGAGSLHHHYVVRKVSGVFEVHRRDARGVTRIGTAHTVPSVKQLIADHEGTWN